MKVNKARDRLAVGATNGKGKKQVSQQIGGRSEVMDAAALRRVAVARCLWPFLFLSGKFCKIFQIFRHIESLNVCIKY